MVIADIDAGVPAFGPEHGDFAIGCPPINGIAIGIAEQYETAGLPAEAAPHHSLGSSRIVTEVERKGMVTEVYAHHDRDPRLKFIRSNRPYRKPLAAMGVPRRITDHARPRSYDEEAIADGHTEPLYLHKTWRMMFSEFGRQYEG